MGEGEEDGRGGGEELGGQNFQQSSLLLNVLLFS